MAALFPQTSPYSMGTHPLTFYGTPCNIAYKQLCSQEVPPYVKSTGSVMQGGQAILANGRESKNMVTVNLNWLTWRLHPNLPHSVTIQMKFYLCMYLCNIFLSGSVSLPSSYRSDFSFTLLWILYPWEPKAHIMPFRNHFHTLSGWGPVPCPTPMVGPVGIGY